MMATAPQQTPLSLPQSPPQPSDDRYAPVMSLDISHIQTEDGAPVDNLFCERQQRLLVETLYTGWHAPDNAPFAAMSNVGLFYGLYLPPLVPDMLLSLGVSMPQGEDIHRKERSSYFIWEYAKPPEVVVEVVSNRIGKEFEFKRRTYAEIGVAYYIVYDPELYYGGAALTLYELNGGIYTPRTDLVLPMVGLRATLRQSTYEGSLNNWLRWQETDGRILPTAEEAIAAQAERADAETQRADAERERAERLAQKLRDLGVNPDTL